MKGGNARNGSLVSAPTSRLDPILDHLRQIIRERVLVIHSKETIDELQTFVVHANGKEAAQSGSHDDRVMSLALPSHVPHVSVSRVYTQLFSC